MPQRFVFGCWLLAYGCFFLATAASLVEVVPGLEVLRLRFVIGTAIVSGLLFGVTILPIRERRSVYLVRVLSAGVGLLSSLWVIQDAIRRWKFWV
jgi:hypothetical protein